MTGDFAGTATFGAGETNETRLNGSGIFVAKYDSTGMLVWAKRAGGTGADEGRGIAVDSSGNSYVTGFFNGTATFGPGEANETVLTVPSGSGAFVAKYDNIGLLLWARQVGLGRGFGIAVDGSGSSYVTGHFQTVLTGSALALVAKYDNAGHLIWAKQVEGTNVKEGRDIVADGSGNNYVTGLFRGTATFGPGEANQTILTTPGDTDIFVAKYDSDGNLVWARRAGGRPTEDVGVGIAVDGLGNSYVTGRFLDIFGPQSGTATFGPGEVHETVLTSAGGGDIFVAKYGAGAVCGNGIVEGAEECDDGGTMSGDGCSATCEIEAGDSDGDGISNAGDNCPAVFNPNQSDTNGDGMGDACTQDVAILKITAPVVVTLTALKPSQTKTIIVQIQNQGPQPEIIVDEAALASLLTLQVEALTGTPNVCGNLTPSLSPIGLRFPLTLASLKKVSVRFQVLFTPDCIPDPARSTAAVGHQDYRVNATLDHNAFDGRLDTDPVDDICPHSVTPPFRADPNPDGTLQDKGCGKKQADKTFGAPLLIDVVDKR